MRPSPIHCEVNPRTGLTGGPANAPSETKLEIGQMHVELGIHELGWATIHSLASGHNWVGGPHQFEPVRWI